MICTDVLLKCTAQCIIKVGECTFLFQHDRIRCRAGVLQCTADVLEFTLLCTGTVILCTVCVLQRTVRCVSRCISIYVWSAGLYCPAYRLYSITYSICPNVHDKVYGRHTSMCIGFSETYNLTTAATLLCTDGVLMCTIWWKATVPICVVVALICT